jgi:hypothetical protein
MAHECVARLSFKKTLAKTQKVHSKQEKVGLILLGKFRGQRSICQHQKSFWQKGQINIDPACSGL